MDQDIHQAVNVPPWMCILPLASITEGEADIVFSGGNMSPIQSTIREDVYTIQQKSNSRFMDAHEIVAKDFALVTRPAQNNNTQRWVVKPVGAVCTIQQ